MLQRFSAPGGARLCRADENKGHVHKNKNLTAPQSVALPTCPSSSPQQFNLTLPYMHRKQSTMHDYPSQFNDLTSQRFIAYPVKFIPCDGAETDAITRAEECRRILSWIK
jgi:hypothetical protein